MAGLVELLRVGRVHVGWICCRLASTVKPCVFPCHRVEVRLSSAVFALSATCFQSVVTKSDTVNYWQFMFSPSPIRMSSKDPRFGLKKGKVGQAPERDVPTNKQKLAGFFLDRRVGEPEVRRPESGFELFTGLIGKGDDDDSKDLQCGSA